MSFFRYWAAVVLCLVFTSTVSATVSITPITEDRHVYVEASYSDASGTGNNTDSRMAVFAAPFMQSIATSVIGMTTTASANASQNSSITATSISASGSGDATADTFDQTLDFASGNGISVCDITFSIACDANYRMSGSRSALTFHTCFANIALYSGLNALQVFGAGGPDPGGLFDVTGTLTAGTYRLRAEATGTASASYGTSDAGVASFDVTLSISSQAGVGPGPALELALLQNHPNPVTQATAIPFVLPEEGHVTLRMFDALGRAVTTLVDGNLPAGPHEIAWDAAERPEGVYFYLLEVGGRAITKKLVVRQ
jgi:hypothetical protein